MVNIQYSGHSHWCRLQSTAQCYILHLQNNTLICFVTYDMYSTLHVNTEIVKKMYLLGWFFIVYKIHRCGKMLRFKLLLVSLQMQKALYNWWSVKFNWPQGTMIYINICLILHVNWTDLYVTPYLTVRVLSFNLCLKESLDSHLFNLIWHCMRVHMQCILVWFLPSLSLYLIYTNLTPAAVRNTAVCSQVISVCLLFQNTSEELPCTNSCFLCHTQFPGPLIGWNESIAETQEALSMYLPICFSSFAECRDFWRINMQLFLYNNGSWGSEAVRLPRKPSRWYSIVVHCIPRLQKIARRNFLMNHSLTSSLHSHPGLEYEMLLCFIACPPWSLKAVDIVNCCMARAV